MKHVSSPSAYLSAELHFGTRVQRGRKLAKTKNWRKINWFVGEIWEGMRTMGCTCQLLQLLDV